MRRKSNIYLSETLNCINKIYDFKIFPNIYLYVLYELQYLIYFAIFSSDLLYKLFAQILLCRLYYQMLPLTKQLLKPIHVGIYGYIIILAMHNLFHTATYIQF